MKTGCNIKGCRSKELQETYSGDKLIKLCKAHLLLSLRGISEEISNRVAKALTK